MNPLAVSLIAFGCIFGGTLFGMYLRTVLPEHHLSDESRDVVKLGAAMMATLAALVLGLLIASAKGNFDTVNAGIVQMGSKIILLDRVMAQYGPETKETRELLRSGVVTSIERNWPKQRVGQTGAKVSDPGVGFEVLQARLWGLAPQNDAQRWLQSQALQVYNEMADGKWRIIEQQWYSSLPVPLFMIMVSWLVIIFFSFGLLSPCNATVIAVLFVCALSTAGALLMMLELDHPYGGLIKVSSAPLRNALFYLGR